jgi:glycosyltransferase involved in cell wall biosynthesis
MAAITELISVILSTYRNESALDASLRGFARQTDRNFEIIVADDGSGPATRDLVAQWAARLVVPLKHVWQEDRGFRLAEIRNRAIFACRGNYCIFLDGDCIVRSDFVASHRRLAERGWFVTGNRVLLSSDLTAAILREGLQPESWGIARWIAERGRGRLNRFAPMLRLPLGPLRKLVARGWRAARACNLAVWRADLERIDGFDASFSGWGREDSDLIVRLLRAGVRRKDGRFATGVVHLWHAAADRTGLADNQAKFDAVLHGSSVQAERGLSALRTQEAERNVRAQP